MILLLAQEQAKLISGGEKTEQWLPREVEELTKKGHERTFWEDGIVFMRCRST